MQDLRQFVQRRRLALLSLGFGLVLILPLLMWATFPQYQPRKPIQPPATAQIVRVNPVEGEAIPLDWEPPELNPELEAAAMAFTDTFPLSETAHLSSSLALSDTTEINWVATENNVTGLKGLVASEAINVRDGPSGDYLALATMPQNTLLNITGLRDNWYQISIDNGVTGWVDSRFIAMTGDKTSLPIIRDVPLPNPILTANVNVDAANLRAGPSRTSAVLKVLAPTTVTVLTRRNDWYNVQTVSGVQGWLAADLVSMSPFIARRVPVLRSNPYALEAIRIARQYIGYPYVWGAEYPSEGFDCSGFVKYVFGRLGVELPHGTIEQWQSGIGVKIYNQAELLPGDLIYFDNTWRPGISHVGIYISDGMVIQAISTGKGVRIVSMYEEYWIPRYVGAIRIFQ